MYFGRRPVKLSPMYVAIDQYCDETHDQSRSFSATANVGDCGLAPLLHQCRRDCQRRAGPTNLEQRFSRRPSISMETRRRVVGASHVSINAPANVGGTNASLDVLHATHCITSQLELMHYLRCNVLEADGRLSERHITEPR